MNRSTALFLAFICAATMALAIPVGVFLWQLFLENIGKLGLFWYSTLLSVVASPFFYVMFRRMK